MLHRFRNPAPTRDPKVYASLAPLCGQKDRHGTGWAASGCTDEPEFVTCLTCLKAMSDAICAAPKFTNTAQVA